MRTRHLPRAAYRQLNWIGLFSCLLISAATATERDADPRPNIIWIMADDLGYGDLGCYGQEQIQTPRIDALAGEGLRFTHCYAGSTVCAPSRCALMTGLHTGHCRVRGNDRVPLLPEDTTVATVLKNAGYVCGLFGKWGLGEPDTTGLPHRHGFDRWYGYLNQAHAHNYFPTELYDEQGVVPLPANQDDARGAYTPELVLAEAQQWVKENRQRPFFLYWAMTPPHAHNALGRATGNGMEIPSDEPYADRDWPQPQKNHAAMITMVDRQVGELVDLLESLDLDRQTIIFFTSDNGPHQEGGAKPEFFNSSGPLRGIKRDLTDGGIRVPMIVRWPERIAPGTESDHVWAFWDFLPTAAELASTESPAEIDGISQLPTLLGPAAAGRVQQEHDYLYWEFHERGFKQALRMGDFKVLRLAPDAPLELYNVVEDIAESENIAAAHPELIARAEQILATARVPSPDFPAPLDSESQE